MYVKPATPTKYSYFVTLLCYKSFWFAFVLLSFSCLWAAGRILYDSVTIFEVPGVEYERPDRFFPIQTFLCVVFSSIFGLIARLITCKCCEPLEKIFLGAIIEHQTTYEPQIPDWLEQLEREQTEFTRKQMENYVCHTRDNPTWIRTAQTVRKIQSMLKDVFGKWERLPRGTCMIQIPMKHFKCGVKPTDFEPIMGISEDSRFVYQVVGDFALQVTSYVDGYKSYVAGVTIYLKHPKITELMFNSKTIKKHLKQPEFRPHNRLVSRRITEIYEGLERQDAILTRNEMSYQLCHKIDEDGEVISSDPSKEFINPIETRHNWNKLRVRWCSQLKTIVNVGWIGKRMVHLEWLPELEKFQVQTCETCEDSPPEYQNLVQIE